MAYQQRLIDDTLKNAVASPDVIAAIRPPLPQVVLFPPRTGYGTKDERTPTIESMWDFGHWKPDRRAAYSGFEGAYTGSLSPAIGQNPY